MSTPVIEEAHPFIPYRQLSAEELTARIRRVKHELGERLLILGHHYQRDEVVELADLRGDSYRLSALAAADETCRAIVFCGVHFMAETADILANRPERLARRDGEFIPVVLPDLAAGCSMADMAEIDQVEDCWRQLSEVTSPEKIVPVTYVNSSAAIKAFCGRHGGIVCTSANADAALHWALARGEKVLFLPDQHLGRNTALRMGIPLDEMQVWDPHEPEWGGGDPDALGRARIVLWKGHCSVHQMFLPEHVDYFRRQYPGIKILVHPECMMEVVAQADEVGSTGKIIRLVKEAAPGTRWAVGTELHLVHRLKKEHPEQEIYFLSPVVCMCATMYRIDLPHLCWALENLASGRPVNVIRVDEAAAADALVALERMLELPGGG
ncbi:MAG: quinolinate synthase NadA [Thermogutta sp.]|nr:quinolinate synthase NadA [Thermogutta sp.]